MECEMCGSSGALKKAYIEGTLLSVCERCSGLGKVVEESPARIPAKRHEPEITESFIDPDFSSKVRRARGSAGISMEELAKRISVSVSVLHRIENGMRPTDDVAKRIEKALRIKITGYDSSGSQKTSGKLPPLTLGDIADVKIMKK